MTILKNCGPNKGVFMTSIPASYTIKETREALALGLTVIGAVSAFVAGDTPTGFYRLAKASTELMPAIGNASEITKEMRDLTKEEIDTLVGDVREALPNITENKAGYLIESALDAVACLAKGIVDYNSPDTV
jgi:hypothetical protein